MFEPALRSWLDRSLSEPVRQFKRRQLERAFALPVGFIAACERGLTGPGPFLARDMQAWMQLHPDLGPNNPEVIETDYAELGDLG